MNKVLERQLKRVFGSLESVPKNIEPFLKVVNDTYDHNEEDRAMIERSLDISSKELSELNKRLQLESSALRSKLSELEHINKLAASQEAKMLNLKKKVTALEEEIIKVEHHEDVLPSEPKP